MLVKVKMLRHHGEKLLADRVRGGGWLQGSLLALPEPERRMGRGKMVVNLLPIGDEFEPLRQLFDARLVRIERRGLVLAGVEEFWDRKRCTDYPQAWWCVPLCPAPPRQPTAADLTDRQEAEAQVAEVSKGWRDP